MGHVLGGWSLTGVFAAQTGGTFSVYDGSGSSQCNDSGTNFCEPVYTGGALPSKVQIQDTSSPNTFTLYDLTNAPFMNHEDYCATHSLATPVGTFGAGAGVGAATPFDYDAAGDNYACTAALINLFPGLEAGRNQFRTPGIWNVDTAVSKSFRMPHERHRLIFRADFINLFNHANLYADPVTNIFVPGGSAVVAHKGVPNCAGVTCGTERRNIQLTLRYEF